MLSEALTAVIAAINAFRQREARARALRRIILDEAYANLELCGIILRRRIQDCPADRNKLIMRLECSSRQVLETVDVTEDDCFATVVEHLPKLMRLFTGSPGKEPVGNFEGWSALELYHYCLNKITAIKLLVGEDLETIEHFDLKRRVRNIRTGLLALVKELRRP